ncbi:Bug family tripartite tricarboxylate transporter substrate binding protein [Aminobacter sp. UC22_36]|uniref:Bug family tripartite tricarboxylate transporter substrate binding protein n=1 Tax=Aminobacter sp. UC22_36 TaxID=3374549 RepID=UPI0037568861
MNRNEWISAFALSAALAVAGSGMARAEDGAAFFKDKTVTYIVATAPGGVYDTNGRLVAQYMQKYLPGSTFVVQNMPGAGHLIGTNYIYASEPDGLTFGTFNTGLIYGQLSGDANIRFDLTKMSWIGKVASDPRVIIVTKDSGIESFEQLRKLEQPIKFATAGKGSASMIEATLFVKALKLPIQVVSGYNGNEDQLAMMRGEVQGVIGSRSEFQQFVDEGKGRFLAQVGGKDTDVPQLSSMIEGDTARQIVALIESQSGISRLTAGPTGIPEERLQTLRDAYSKAVSDPEFIEKARTLGLPVDPLVGIDVGARVGKALDQQPDTIEALKEALSEN